MLPQFRNQLLASNFDAARATAVEVGTKAPRVGRWLGQLVDFEEGGESSIPPSAPIAISKLEAMRQALVALLAFRSGAQTVLYTGDFIYSGPSELSARDLNSNHAFMSLCLVASLQFGSPTFLKLVLTRLLGQGKSFKLHPQSAKLLSNMIYELFFAADETLLLNLVELLPVLPNAVTMEALGVLNEVVHGSHDHFDAERERLLRSRLTWLAQQPTANVDTLTAILMVMTKNTQLSHIVDEFSAALLQREDAPVEARFWVQRSLMSNTVDKGRDADHAPWWSLLQEADPALLPRIAYALPFVGFSGDDEQSALKLINEKVSDLFQRYAPLPPAAPQTGRIKLALISSGLSNHGIGHVLHQTLPHLAEHGIDYSILKTGRDLRGNNVYRDTIEEHALEIFEVPQRKNFPVDGSVEKSVELVASMRADVLIDLDGYMNSAAIPIAYHRPAPLNVYWIGHGGKLGLDFYDYTITDAFVGNDGIERQSGEYKLSLPTCFATSGPFEFDRSLTKVDFGFTEDTILVCCFNAHDKISADYLDSLSEVALYNERVHLWFNQAHRHDSVENISVYLKGRGVSEEQFSFVDRVEPKALHYARIHVTDFAMDTFYVNMSSGALDNIWGECPVITVPGQTYYSRICGSFNEAIGLPEFNAQDRTAYVDLAKALIDDPERLRRARATMGANKADSSLFSGQSFAAELAAGLKLIVERQRAGLSPKDLSVGHD